MYVMKGKARTGKSAVYHEYGCKHLRYSPPPTKQRDPEKGDDTFKEEVYAVPRQWARRKRTACNQCSGLPRPYQRCEMTHEHKLNCAQPPSCAPSDAIYAHSLRIWQMERMVVLGTTYYVDTELAMLVMLVHRDPEDEVDPIRALSGDSKHYAVRVAVAFDELPEIHRSSQQTPVPQQSE